MLLRIILTIVIVFIVRFGCPLLQTLAKEVGLGDVAGGDAGDEQIEEADQGHQNADSRVNRVIRVEEQQGHEDHEHALAVEEGEELEVLEHALPLELCDEKQAGEGEQVDGQYVEEGVRWPVILRKVGEADDGRCAKPQDGQKVEDMCDIVQAGAIHLLIILIFHLINI